MGRWFEHVDTPADQGLRTITPAEVARHAKINDCWIVHNGRVFDCTEFLYDHPGGEELILQFAGKDVGDVLDDPIQHVHSNSAYLLMEEYLIGKVPADYVATPVAPIPPAVAPVAGRAAGAVFAEGKAPAGTGSTPTGAAPTASVPTASTAPTPRPISPEDPLGHPVMARNSLAPPAPTPPPPSVPASTSQRNNLFQGTTTTNKEKESSGGLGFLKFVRRR